MNNEGITMRKVVVSEYVTLDGVMEDPGGWSFQFWNDEAGKFKFDEQGFADRMNSLPKFVVSTTLKEVEWNNSRLIKGNIAEEVTKLKQQPGQNILIGGSGDLVHTLMQHDLIDEYRIMVHPVVLGRGKRLFRDGSDTRDLRLVETKTFSSGVVVLSYEPARIV